MKYQIKLHTIFRLVIAVFVVFTLVFSTRTTIKADELSDLNNLIQQKQKEKDQTLKKISDIEKNIKNILSAKGDLNTQLSQLNGQKSELEKQISDLESQIKSQEAVLKEYSDKLVKRQGDMQEKTNYVYKLTYLQPDMIFGSEQSAKDYYDDLARTNATIELFKAEIRDYQDKINTVTATKEQIENDKKTISESRATIASQIDTVQKQLNQYNSSLASANSSKNVLSAQINTLSAQLNGLTAQQKQLLDAEIAKMNASHQTNQVPLQSGQYFFTGRGRDLIEGHGLGMSQWGAYGMAKQGWSYDRILTFYYTGTNIGDYQEPQEIRVPDKASSYPPEAKARGYLTTDEYLSGLGEVSNSWPAEAVKAQVVAARTYIMRVCNNQAVCSICGNSSCQVYNGVTSADPGGMGKKPFVESTKGKVILYKGSPIVAYYSASHRGMSTNICTAWPSYNSSGVKSCTDLPYIQPVNDDQYAYKEYYTTSPYNSSERIYPYNWKWRTNGYSLEQLSAIFRNSSRLNVGNVTNIQLTKGPSNRVSLVKITGSAGTKYLSGWDFRTIFNSATTYSDYLYSTEFDFYQK